MTHVNTTMLTQIADDVCHTMLGVALTSADCDAPDGTRWVATVRISGEYTAFVEIETDRAVAQRMACRMFSLNPHELSEEDLRDAIGEVANMIGGNVKGVLSAECNLSIPCVEVRDFFPADQAEGIAVSLSCEGSPFLIRFVTGHTTTLAT